MQKFVHCCFLLWHDDAECGCYALFVFGTKAVIEYQKVFLLQHSLLTVFNGLILDFFLTLMKNINYRAKVKFF